MTLPAFMSNTGASRDGDSPVQKEILGMNRYIRPASLSAPTSKEHSLSTLKMSTFSVSSKPYDSESIYGKNAERNTPSITRQSVERGMVRSADLHKGLKSRHIQMFSIAGMLGTGVFLASSVPLRTAGPLGALLGYGVMGLITASIAHSAGEMSAFMPLSGGFARHVTAFVDKGLGATVGWNFWYALAITQAVEITAASILVSYWAPDVNPAVWIAIFWIAIVLVNLGPVRYYGETEFFFAILKISLIVGLIIAGIIIDLGGVKGQGRIGFRYWKDPGPFRQLTYEGGSKVIEGSAGRFLAFWSTLINAAFAYANVQIVGVAGAETINSRVAIPKAVRRTYVRIVLFYVLSIFVLGLIVPSTSAALFQSDGTAATAPFVIAIKAAGIKVLPSIVNAVVLTSAFSSGVACVFISSRTLVGLANDGMAHRIFLKTNRIGNPYVAVLLSSTFGAFAFLSVQEKAMQVLLWLVNLSAVAGLVSWVFLCLAYIRMRAGMKAQGYSGSDLPYESWGQPYLAWFGLISCSLIVFFSGFQVFLKGDFSATTFLSNYINVFLFIAFYLVWKFFTGTLREVYIPAERIDLGEFDVIKSERAEAGLITKSSEETEENADSNTVKGGRLMRLASRIAETIF